MVIVLTSNESHRSIQTKDKIGISCYRYSAKHTAAREKKEQKLIGFESIKFVWMEIKM